MLCGLRARENTGETGCAPFVLLLPLLLACSVYISRPPAPSSKSDKSPNYSLFYTQLHQQQLSKLQPQPQPPPLPSSSPKPSCLPTPPTAASAVTCSSSAPPVPRASTPSAPPAAKQPIPTKQIPAAHCRESTALPYTFLLLSSSRSCVGTPGAKNKQVLQRLWRESPQGLETMTDKPTSHTPGPG